MFLDFSKYGRWTARFKKRHPCVHRQPPDMARLRLILGVGRSGTTWVSRVLSSTAQPARFLAEPLFHIHPKLPYHTAGDHTAIGYNESGQSRPLLTMYQLVAHPQFDCAEQPGKERNDAGWTICLAKEVHALLGTEAILRAWQTPTLFILRDPIYLVDSLLAAQTLAADYLNHETAAVQTPAFLDRFAPGQQAAVERAFADFAALPSRRQIILKKVLCIALFQKMFRALAGEFPCAHAMAYEEFCGQPQASFPTAARALGLPWDEAMAACLRESMRGDAAAAADPYSTSRHTASQKNRDFKFLTAEEVAAGRATLEAFQA